MDLGWKSIGLAVSLVCGGALALPVPAQAQLIAGPGLGGHPANQQPQREPPPPSLPGAQTDKDRVTPADKTTLDMPPTEALFDAINRGDIASARDAISRGAELNGHNLLGMTPLDLSVDLGRNNITFLLLSMRNADSARPSRTAAAAPPPAKTARQRVARQARPIPQEVSVKAPTRQPALFAGDGGAPVPAAGFLGFGENRGETLR